MSKNVLFIHLDTVIPEYVSSYEGYYVQDSLNDLYLGTSDGWKKLNNDTIDTQDVSSATEDSTGLAKAYDVKSYVDSKLTSTDSYSFVLDDNGELSCVKNNTGEGFQLNSDGSLELI
jgi:hypothetical protein